MSKAEPPCPCCPEDPHGKKSFINFTSNSGNDYEDLVTLKFNQMATSREFSGTFNFSKKPGFDLDFEGWEVLNSHLSYSTAQLEKDHPVSQMLMTKGDAALMAQISIGNEDSPRFVELNVVSHTDEIYDLLNAIVGDSVHEEEQAENEREVRIGYWAMSSMGPNLTRRTMVAQPWDEIKHNYAASVGSGLTQLMDLDPKKVAGKMLLLHGEPGTGKTSSLRTLALSWKKWCDLEVVIDPERLFTDSDYLLTVLQQRRDVDRWIMLLLEDCDELIRKEAKSISGQALSRLLNATDGFLGQGLNLLIGITSNEPLEKLHPAVLRSGRCLAKLEVPPLSQDEAVTWLNDPELASSIKGPTTLADLYALRSDQSVITDKKVESVTGMYL